MTFCNLSSIEAVTFKIAFSGIAVISLTAISLDEPCSSSFLIKAGTFFVSCEFPAGCPAADAADELGGLGFDDPS